MAANNPQKGTLADGRRALCGEEMSGAAAGGKTEMVDDVLHAHGPPPKRNRDMGVGPLGEYLLRPVPPQAAQAPDCEFDLDGTAMRGQVCERPLIPAVNTRRKWPQRGQAEAFDCGRARAIILFSSMSTCSTTRPLEARG